jgi:S-layer protein
LTTGVDNIVGTSGNDTINATNTSTSPVLGALDVVDGGAGTDTLNIADTATLSNADFFLPSGFTIKNVEVLNVTTNGSIGTGGGAAFDISTIAGLTSFTGVAAGSGTGGGSNLKAAGTTDVTLTVAGSHTAEITGGKVVKVTAGTGAVTVKGDALTAVTVTNGGLVNIDNVDALNNPGKGTTLTAVTLGNDADSTVKGKSIATIDLSGQGAGGTARTITVNNSTSDHALTINANGTGYKTDGTELPTVVTDTAAKSLTINTTAKSSINASSSVSVTTVTLTGSGALTLAPMGSNTTTINGSAATGNLTLGDLNSATVTVSTGSGNDSLSVQATAKTTIATGAGNDTVTLKSTLAAGSTINLGAGNDKLLFGTGGSVAASSGSNVTVIDGGDGTDMVSARLLNAGNAAQFKNFELLNLDSTLGFDLALLGTNNTITGLTISTASNTATYQNVKKSMSLTVDFVGNNSKVVNTLSMTDVSGTDDAYTITFAANNSGAAPTSANVSAGTVVTSGIEHYNIVSGGTKAWNEITLGTNTAAKTVTITGASNLDLAFGPSFGSTTGVSLIDGSAATGKLSINLTNVTAATAGIEVKGGSAADTLTTSTFAAKLTGGAGADNFVVAATLASSPSNPVITTITDFTVGTDKITFKDTGNETFTSTKIDVSTATALFGGAVNALDLAAAGNGGTNAVITWFQYAGDTYIVQDRDASPSLTANDIVVKLSGLVDLSTLTVSDFGFV